MKKKKKIILIFVIFIVLIGITITTILLLNHKQEDKNNIIASSIECLQVLNSEDSAQSALLIKENIVKITNKINDDTKIVGTGFFHESGYLITNSHIVDIKGEITIKYYDNSESKAILVSNDITSDIAILSVDSPKVLAMSFANTLKLNVTDEVYGIGYAYNLEGEASVSKGILSARRSAGGIEFLQSDISLNSGNSGGPLVNDKAELLGINTYATENASISMAISSESLDIIINKLINNKQVNYLTKERETNALSVALKEIGYEVKDIYEENDIISKIFNNDENSDSNNDSNIDSDDTDNDISNNSNNKIYTNKSSESRLSSLTINGYSVDFNPDELSYCVLLRNKNDSTLNINAIPKDSESRITIKNNNIVKGKNNKISIEVLAPNKINGHTYDIYAISTNDVLEPNRLSKINLYSTIEYVSSKVANYYKIFWEYTDRDGALINYDRDNITSIVSNYTIDVYVKRHIYDGESLNTEEKLLKSYTFNGSSTDFGCYDNGCNIEKESAYIKVDDIRSFLNDEDYTENGAEIIFKASINTYHQGTLKGETWLWLNK